MLYSNDTPYNYNDDLAYFGVQFDPQYANELYISRVLPGTYAYRIGLRPGDVINNWDGLRGTQSTRICSDNPRCEGRPCGVRLHT